MRGVNPYMAADVKVYLWDIREAARAIEGFLTGVTENDYQTSDLLRSAVERKFEIIGEALNQLAKTNPVTGERIPDIGQIIAFRNDLIHGARPRRGSLAQDVSALSCRKGCHRPQGR